MPKSLCHELVSVLEQQQKKKVVSKGLIGARDRGGNRTASVRGGEQDG